ncbi:MAG TPA: efflux RND transporter periplasmic adaptor subunit [Pyrinomonadaceae bacterium]|jgi:multidrug efflux system membrane fusion protein|nr:efflux RND transporter periplasmic adaptor subunit [Pyrinomonadaceae bacterium]
MKLFFLKLATAAALSVLTFTSCTNKAAPTGQQRPPAPVTVAEAAMQDVPVYLDAIGKTAARETVAIQPQVSGRILKIHFTDGANVKKGDLLFTIDPAPFEAAVSQAQANVTKDVAVKKQAEANLNRDAAVDKWNALQVKRYAQLVSQGVVPREQYEQLAATSDSSKATVEADRAAIHSADESIKADNAVVERAKVDLSYCYIKSPIDGRAGQRLVDVGNVVNPGGSSGNNTSNGSTSNGAPSNALLVIERLDPIYADFTISQNDLSRVQEQMHAGTLKTEVRLPDATDPIAGTLTFLDNSVQNQTGQVNLRATVPNSDRRFWPGRFVNIRLVLNTIRGAVLVPATAPQMSGKGSYVYVVKQDMTVDQRQVTLGQRQGDQIVIENGVQPGEKVVTNGQVAVTPGGKVRIEEPKNNQAASGTN